MPEVISTLLGLSSLLTNPTYEVPTLNPKPLPKPQKVGKIIAQDP